MPAFSFRSYFFMFVLHQCNMPSFEGDVTPTGDVKGASDIVLAASCEQGNGWCVCLAESATADVVVRLRANPGAVSPAELRVAIIGNVDSGKSTMVSASALSSLFSKSLQPLAGDAPCLGVCQHRSEGLFAVRSSRTSLLVASNPVHGGMLHMITRSAYTSSEAFVPSLQLCFLGR